MGLGKFHIDSSPKNPRKMLHQSDQSISIRHQSLGLSRSHLPDLWFPKLLPLPLPLLLLVLVLVPVLVLVVGDALACLRAISACRLVFFGAGDEGFRNVPEEEANFSNMDAKLEDVEGPFSLVFTTLLTLSRLIRSNQDAKEPGYDN